ncbi:two-component sensor histidine kinase [Microtetraspora sp. NBRC 13810]|uniref:sensor histidine kinase n=1 Tax=Microtetraspora sp. NBRC 13810 TaxID=3030990 RepID=UPI0024A07F25|nr:HAMP domain-containing sensor histidine kinase [Microtetraspora sp. NBRC 13810]GLW05705.1 two-component sensor histidine kinase [Microtetraspora sp. NBRC 13810]
MTHLRSIQARYTTTATLLLMVILIAVGASTDLAIRYHVEDGLFRAAERVASQWSAAARHEQVPGMIPASAEIALVQLVASDGTILAASRQAPGGRPLSTSRPPADDRFQRLVEGGNMLMAIRVTPAADAPVVYAGSATPGILRGHRLEYLLALGILLLSVLAAWLVWAVVGRTLRPVAGIRARIAEITVSDLSLRVPVPPGEDEIAQLARTANQTLARLEGAVEQQRQFAATASHELRTPITGLRMQLEEALRYPGEVDPVRSMQGALSVTDRLEAIVNDLLALARLRAADPTPPEPIDLGELVSKETMHPPGTPVDVRTAPGVWVRGSQIQLIRVLGNLLSNAVRHAESRVTVYVESVDGQAVMAVADDGAGIAPADRERVFERFTRLEDGRFRDSGGSGLGLAISRDIARAHHGTLRIEDSPRGARFVLRLPLLEESPEYSRKATVRDGVARDVGAAKSSARRMRPRANAREGRTATGTG